MKDIRAVAFDCDGVMFDTIQANMAYYNHILEHFGRPAMTPEQLAYSHMHTADQAIANLFEDKKSIEAAQAYRKKMSYLPFLRFMDMEPYLKPLLARLRPRYKTAVATNRSDTMDRVITEHGLDGCFDLVVSALDVDHPKPHPEPLIKVMEHFKINHDQLMYIGDSTLDETAARAAGAVFVAYKNKSLSAEFYIQSLKDMEGILLV
ncbi:MAG: HAD-IA family hydrolase [Pseudomonadota bacterium]|uniref:phosphoglycolate phosphatase n=1 Tax=Candidatus Desulfatibia profunda TaxID=2841695 RepID=A0A8J6NSQ7_9BACT|nr:HAD-IA family hydrolase [Candidatus Desulfatibia profunda]MBL7181107.1 HAD-IA family hydrolase [Desulfobacterales bacterium]